MARYIDADLFIEQLRELQKVSFTCLSKVSNEAIDLGLSLAIRMARKVPTAEVTDEKCSKWIDVKDRLPKLDTEVIVATESMVFCAMRRKHDRRQFWTNAVWNYMPIESFTGKILFWMPLPEHPRIREEKDKQNEKNQIISRKENDR